MDQNRYKHLHCLLLLLFPLTKSLHPQFISGGWPRRLLSRSSHWRGRHRLGRQLRNGNLLGRSKLVTGSWARILQARGFFLLFRSLQICLKRSKRQGTYFSCLALKEKSFPNAGHTLEGHAMVALMADRPSDPSRNQTAAGDTKHRWLQGGPSKISVPT